jgi:release factor glutamine methyltransferase
MGKPRHISLPSRGVAGLPERSHSLPAPPLRGSRIGAADPRGVRRGSTDEASLVQPPSLALPLKGGGESERPGLQTMVGAVVGAARLLRQAGIETPELDARLLLCHAAGLSHEAYVAGLEDGLEPHAAARFGAYVERRLAGEPVSRIIGVREFYGRTFRIDASTLDPRPDTETLVEAALALVDREGLCERPLKLLDLGTGSGCILITLLAELPQASGVGVDVSLPALQAARKNAHALGVGTRASFVASDWLEAVEGSFDLVVANPPYLSAADMSGLALEVRDHDPGPALDGGPDGLSAYRRIAPGLRKALRPGGFALFEIGHTQAEAVSGFLVGAGLAPEEEPWRDLAGRPRVVAARSRVKAP